MMQRLPKPIPGRRTGRRVTTTTAQRHLNVKKWPWPGYTFDILIRPGKTGGWDLPREFDVHAHEGELLVIHEWSRK